jgi:hypothetical protein
MIEESNRWACALPEQGCPNSGPRTKGLELGSDYKSVDHVADPWC